MDHYYTPEDLNDLDKDELELIAEVRSVEVDGTGAGGNVVKDDLIAAITAAQNRSGINPALVAEPEPEHEEIELTCRVTGVQETLGHQPGETFTAVISRQQAQMLIASGHITEIKEN